MTDIDLGGYVQVDERIAEFREKFPEGSLQPANLEQPYTLEFVGDDRTCFIVYTAAAYRTPDDPRPGIGCAWEPFPGRTPYTRNSELMNAETSAWGRAIVAALAADAKRGIATAEEVRNRKAEGEVPPAEKKAASKPSQKPSAPVTDLEAAKALEVPFGKHKGSTLRHIAHTDEGYLEWLATKCDKPDVSSAAKLVLDAWKAAKGSVEELAAKVTGGEVRVETPDPQPAPEPDYLDADSLDEEIPF